MSLKLTTNKICPFAQRVWLCLEASGLPYTLNEVDIKPGTKTSAFTALYKTALGADPSSDGKVPILEDGGVVLTESLHVADYVCSKALVPLLPALPLERFATGLFLEQGVSKYVPPFYALLMKQDAEGQEAARKSLIQAMQAISAHLKGPFLLGESASYGDFMLWPFVERLCILEHYRGFTLEKAVAEEPSIAPFLHWREAMLQVPCVKKCAQEPALFVKGYESYATGSK